MCDTCGDNRFELIEKYKQKLLDATNIGDSPEEMAVIDNILFRFWQMGWLEKLELFGNSEQLDTISRQAAFDALNGIKIAKVANWYEFYQKALTAVGNLPSAQETITYRMCADSMLKMWMDNVLTDGEYNRIMDKLNAWKGNPDAD